jgi:hypothetical protein
MVDIGFPYDKEKCKAKSEKKSKKFKKLSLDIENNLE